MRNPLIIGVAAMALAFATSPPLAAQQGGQQQAPAQESQGDRRFWQASLPGGEYVVLLERVVSVSRHRYLLDGAVIVDEVTIDTEGQALARFYHLTPVTEGLPANPAGNLLLRGRELAEGAARRGGTELQDMVVKRYPDTTHARTIEFRLSTAGELDALFESARTAWTSGRGRQFSVAAP